MRAVAITIAMLGVIGLGSVQADEQILNKLRADLVKEKDGKFMLDRYRACQVVRPQARGGGMTQPFRVKAHVEAPKQGVISRDNFVALATEIAVSLRVGLVQDLIKDITPVEAIDAVRCLDIEGGAGALDFQINVTMAQTGVQTEIIDIKTGRQSKQTHPWPLVFGQ